MLLPIFPISILHQGCFYSSQLSGSSRTLLIPGVMWGDPPITVNDLWSAGSHHLHIYFIKWIKVLICKSLRGLRQFTTRGPAYLFTAALASHSSGIKNPRTPKCLLSNSWRRNSTENRTQTLEFLPRKTYLCPSVSSHQSELRAPSVKPNYTQKNPRILIHPCMSY